jgi:hypothetical protein
MNALIRIRAFLQNLRVLYVREWPWLPICFSAGAMLAGLYHLAVLDHKFHEFTRKKLSPVSANSDGPGGYRKYFIVIVLALILAASPYLWRLIMRSVRSWWSGVICGMRLICLAFGFIIFLLRPQFTLPTIFSVLTLFLGTLLIANTRYLIAISEGQRLPKEDEICVPDTEIKLRGTKPIESDDPIKDWCEDILDRVQIVNALTFNLLIARSPVVALFAPLGAGKTSVLNLLRRHLEHKAIVVSFSTWLPGSGEVLTASLLSDIAEKCSRTYIVPGLRRKTRKLAGALARSIPPFSAFSDLISDTTQQEDIEILSTAITRLPKRVIVLLDELDRMDSEEVSSLVKVLRGISASPNLSFVCAGDRRRIEEALMGEFDATTHEYFEKFFPVSVSMAELDAAALRELSLQRVLSAFRLQGWFDVPADQDEFSIEFRKLWNDCFSPFLSTVRAIGMLANNVGVASRRLRDEVNPIDLALLELIRQFEPVIYENIWEHRGILTEGEDWTSAEYRFRTDEQRATIGEELLKRINSAEKDPERLASVKRMMHRMFPKFSKIDKERFHSETGSKTDKHRRISDPDIFPAYFRYQLPDTVFSNRQISEFAKSISGTQGKQTRSIFDETFNSMEKGDRRRADFLDKLSTELKDVPLSSSQDVAFECMAVADQLVYDSMFVAIGEAGHVLRIIIRTTERTPLNERAAFLSKCLEEATDDTMAFRILTVLPKPGQDFNLQITSKDLYPSFIKRMRKRYGPEIDATTIDLTTSDPQAFNWWGLSELRDTEEIFQADPKDRLMQNDFWIRYIGSSRARLADTFGRFFMPHGLYDKDPTQFIENKIPIASLQHLNETVSKDEVLSESQKKELHRFERFLAGKFEHGIGFGDLERDEAEDSTAKPPSPAPTHTSTSLPPSP